jgi:tetratricopeptide (TPR) repeat protein
LVFGAVALLVPVAQAWRERRPVWAVLAAATVPISLIGLGMMLYNELRFDNPLEFGVRYLLNAERQITRRAFSAHFLWFNFRVYFLEPARWSARFPFVHVAPVPPLPAGSVLESKPFGVLANIPLTWLALAAPLAWRGRSGQTASVLRWFVAATALLFAMCAFTLGLFYATGFDYELDFLPPLLLLAVIGILGLERALTNRPVWRRAARCGWGVLLGLSVAFNLLATAEHYAEAHTVRGDDLMVAGRHQEAIEQYERALHIEPDYARAHNNLGHELLQAGKIEEAIAHDEQALRLKPDFAEAHYNLGLALAQTGRIKEGIAHYEQALRLKPDYADAHNNLANALAQTGRIGEAIAQYEHALRIKPDYAEAHSNLGSVLLQEGKLSDAIAHFEQALRIKPDLAEAHSNLGVALGRAGRIEQAIAHYEQALRLKPDYAEARYNFGLALAQAGRVQEAMEQWQQTLRIKPDDVEAHYNLGIALEKAGRLSEAIQHYQQALKLRPDLTGARNALARLQAGR